MSLIQIKMMCSTPIISRGSAFTLHDRLPGFAGTLGISLVAALETVSFPRVEGWSYNSVMVTSNFRQTIEGLFTAFAGNADARPFRRPYVFGAICIAFNVGTAIGAFATKSSRAYNLGVPVTLLTIVLLQCERGHLPAETSFCETWFAEGPNVAVPFHPADPGR